MRAAAWVPSEEVMKWLRKKYRYKEETGRIYDRKSGEERGGTRGNHGYLLIGINNRALGVARLVLMHQMAWLLYHWEWPTLEIDHINNDKTDNRIANLRLATRSQNMMNTAKRQSIKGRPSSSRHKGVTWDKATRKWLAQIKLNGKLTHLGRFATQEEAFKAYTRAAMDIQGDFLPDELKTVT